MEKLFDDEIKIARMVFDLYCNSSSIAEYSYGISRISKQMRLEIKYLRSLKNLYYEIATSDQKRKHNLAKEKYKNERLMSVDFVDDILKKGESERIKYLIDMNIPTYELEKRFSLYINNKQLSEIQKANLKQIYNDFISAIENLKKENNIEKRNNEIKDAIKFFDSMILSGNNNFYDINEYIDYYCQTMSVSKRTMAARVSKYKKILENEGLLADYMLKIEDMRKNKYEEMHESIDIMLKNISQIDVNSFDIVDYYLLIGLPIMEFKKLCKGFISSIEMSKFNYLTTKFIGCEKNYVPEDEIMRMNYSFIVNGERYSLTETEKLYVIEFLKENNISLSLYQMAAFKYINGTLDRYLKSKSKNYSKV